MKRDPYWKGRLERWQLWVFTAPGGARSAFYVERVDCAQQFGNLTPAINDEAIVTDQHVAHVLLVGFVNIHTDQAELLMHHLDDPALRAPPIIDLTAVAETVSL